VIDYERIEDLISEGAKFSAQGEPRVALDRLRQASILLFRARLEVDAATLEGLAVQAERERLR
jgi:hypothetical protein